MNSRSDSNASTPGLHPDTGASPTAPYSEKPGVAIKRFDQRFEQTDQIHSTKRLDLGLQELLEVEADLVNPELVVKDLQSTKNSSDEAPVVDKDMQASPLHWLVEEQKSLSPSVSTLGSQPNATGVEGEIYSHLDAASVAKAATPTQAAYGVPSTLTAVPSNLDTAAVEIQPSLGAFDAQCRELNSKGQWVDLATVAETELRSAELRSEPQSRILSKCWWVRAQIELGIVPLGALSAPMEELTSAAVGESRGVQQRVVSVASILRDRLVAEGDEALAGIMTASLAPILAGLTLPKSVSITEAEEIALRSRDSSQAPSQVSSSVRPGLGIAEVKQLLCNRKTILASGIALGLLLLVFIRNETSSSAVAYSDITAADLLPTLELPRGASVAAPLEHIKTSASLDAIMHELEKSEPRIPVESIQKPSSPSATGSLGSIAATIQQQGINPAPVEAAARQPSVALSTGRVQKATLDLSGPKEPEEVRRARILGPEAAGMDGSSTTDPGRALFPEDRAAAEKAQQAHGGAAGSPDSGYATGRRTQAEGEVFDVIEDTDVYQSSSYSSDRVSSLFRGEQVRVMGKEGRFARILSKKGRYGFVPLKDLRSTGKVE